MSSRKRFCVLYLLFIIFNIVDFYTTSVCFGIPDFRELNPAVVFLNEKGLFLEMKMGIIFAVGAVGAFYKKELVNKGLLIFDLLLGAVCVSNIIQLVYFVG